MPYMRSPATAGTTRRARWGSSLIDAVDRYFDDEVCALREAEYTRDTGAKVQCWSGTHRYKSPFPVTFGRYIGPLVKFYLATGRTSRFGARHCG